LVLLLKSCQDAQTINPVDNYVTGEAGWKFWSEKLSHDGRVSQTSK
jgi:hypothetical protein